MIAKDTTENKLRQNTIKRVIDCIQLNKILDNIFLIIISNTWELIDKSHNDPR